MRDWILSSDFAPAEIMEQAGKITLSNGLIRREIMTEKCVTVSEGA